MIRNVTMPQGAAGLDAGWIADWVNKNDLSKLAGRTQSAVTKHYQREVAESRAWKGPGGFIDVFFNIIMGGFGTLTKFIENLVQVITGKKSGGLGSIGDFLADRWKELTDSFNWLNALVEGIVKSITDFFDEPPIKIPVIADVITGIGRMLGLSRQAQNAADAANKQIAIVQASLVKGGTLIIDDFARGSSTDLGADWEQWYTGPGGGTLGVDGKGNAVWRDAGMEWRRGHGRFKAKVMTTNSGSVSVVVKDVGEAGFLGSELAYNWLYARMTPDRANYVYLRWTREGLEIGYALGGAERRLDSVSWRIRNGDTLDFQYGRGNQPYLFKAFVNGIPGLSVTDSARVSLMNANTRSVGLSAQATRRGLGQTTPSSVAVFTAVDAA